MQQWLSSVKWQHTLCSGKEQRHILSRYKVIFVPSLIYITIFYSCFIFVYCHLTYFCVFEFVDLFHCFWYIIYLVN